MFTGELTKMYFARFAPGAPLVVTGIAGGVALWHAPDGLASRHSEYTGMLGTVGQLIGTVLVALAIEARTPFVRTAFGATKWLVASGALVIAIGALASVVALSPDLPVCLYAPLFGVAMGGLVGGLAAVVHLGIAFSIGGVAELEVQSLLKLERSGDLGATARLDELGIARRR